MPRLYLGLFVLTCKAWEKVQKRQLASLLPGMEGKETQRHSLVSLASISVFDCVWRAARDTPLTEHSYLPANYRSTPSECKIRPLSALQLFAVPKQRMTEAYEALAYIQKRYNPREVGTQAGRGE